MYVYHLLILPHPFATPPPGMHMVNDALVQLAHAKARWMAVYLDISPQCIKLLDKDVSIPHAWWTALVSWTTTVSVFPPALPPSLSHSIQASNLSFTEHRVRFISFLGIGADERYVRTCVRSVCRAYVTCASADTV